MKRCNKNDKNPTTGWVFQCAYIGAVADSTLVMKGGYKVLTKDEIIAILHASL